MSEWQVVILKTIVDYIVDNRGKTPPTTQEGIELIEVNAIRGRFPDYSMIRKYVNENIYMSWFRSGHPKQGDILIPTVGTIGNVSIMEQNRGTIAQNLIAIRIKEHISKYFIYYYLSSSIGKNYLLSLDIGGVQPSIKVPHLLGMEIPIPPLPG